ncbi:MAG: DUF2497 domain-containing protein [Hyphomicrobium sp.]
MTRLDPTGGEPSMEEILASIRKIIAEDPPGSRPEPGSKPNRPVSAPEGNSSGISSLGSAVQPHIASAESKDAAENTPAPASEEAQDVKAATASFFSHRPSLDSPRAQAEPLPTMKPVTPFSTNPFAGPPQRQVSTFDIDAQLADVLGGPAKTDSAQSASGLSLGTSAAAPPQNFNDPVQGALDSHAAPAVETAPVKAAAPSPAGASSDPFEFSLGPSPFARKEMPQPAEAKPEPSKDIFGSFVPVREPWPSAKPDFTSASPQPPPPAEKSSQPDFSTMNSFTAVSQSAATATEPQDKMTVAPTQGSSGSQSVDSEPADDPFGEISFRPKAFGTSPAFPASSADKVSAPLSSPSFEPLEQLTRAAHGMHQASYGALERSQTQNTLEQNEPEVSDASETIEDSVMDVQQTASFETTASDAHEPETEQEEKATAEETAPAALSDLAPRSFETASVNVGGISAILTEMPSETAASDDADVEVVEPELENNSNSTQLSDENAQREMEADARMQSYAASDDATAGDGRSLVPHSRDNENVPAPRTMEETVAELLRPMLKTWLAENMPKIVERALRKELAESKPFAHKTAAE